MKKKFVFFCIISLMTFTVACQTMDDSKSIDEKLAPIETVEKTPAYLDVSHDGGLFSSRDLIYFIMSDRFNDGTDTNNPFKDVNPNDPKAYHGGDLQGVIDLLSDQSYSSKAGQVTLTLEPSDILILEAK